jgi:hypothetical protein
VLGCALQKRGTSATRINNHKEDTNIGNAVVIPELVDLPSSTDSDFLISILATTHARHTRHHKKIN